MDADVYEEACVVFPSGISAGSGHGPSSDTGIRTTQGSEISGEEARFSPDISTADVPNGYIPGVGMGSPGQSQVLTSAILKTISVLTVVVLNICLLGTVIFVAVTVLDLKLSVSQLDQKISADMSDLKMSVSQLDRKISVDVSDLKLSVSRLERLTSTLTSTQHAVISAWPRQVIQGPIKQNAVGTTEGLPGTVEDETTTSAHLKATCPDGYKMYREVCYKVFDTYKTFSQSAETCRADGGTLAMPRDAGINAFLYSLTTELGSNDDFWVGLHDQGQEGQWMWLDGTALGAPGGDGGNYSAWAADQPNSFTGEEDCALLHTGWYDHNCQSAEGFICQVMP
ncbi:PREDICTED: C-type lectin domain family 4 member M-like [Branchiostoma belcheri]|uniref:C-type lectin domain family 4 member M-like n=1 Tax=Branchiostoma belcheri TaxID=7741 RepID=A0A6P4YF36_BRABE|nr:PREDICTED: C-type lectin domain family 4 member M-like [Branchiostoma belcheri]